MQATVQTNMRREIDEIPEAAARLLDRLAKDFAATGAALRAEDSEFVVTVACGLSDYVPEIVHRAEGEIAPLRFEGHSPQSTISSSALVAALPCRGSHARHRSLDRSDE
ncbi:MULTISPECIES: hypothetical protein [Rhizobium]|uniref:Uncharacterized protein n=1 Tax=Rhizobium leguminosarum bv. viciae TaxID=387 RepID=A0A4R0BHQ3_RHILV|nr:hypothetical protein [Rhizobium leguminosarum]NKK10367.1 hypothetical protein [Rhizobium leguminosarum bv. viciae]NKK23521.1 hypothetical protein [Rhizobium leguminosarum bv. viciae]TBX87978.1 hypothetical protein E0H31_27490 [Rhizobium leguminosarum bv. viciae]TBY77984.1 hypothetical protein E0H32_24405 [Rhizobium leguminosarum bv. viciae]TBZ07410.1 hypothetical protein E0H38_29705 [Rhizobium leguminosarum bv. viciae]